MSRPILYLAVTGHGFGHAVRVASVAETLRQQCPEILLILVTSAPRWLLESYIKGDFIHRPRAFDVGVIQRDSLIMDKTATLEKMQHIRSQQNAIVSSEVNYIKNNKVGLILADIPALASAIAKSADIPCWMMGNFGWDFIYRAWGEQFSDIANWISDCYSQSDRLFRLPLAEPMNSFKNITEVGLTGGNPRYTEEHLRQLFSLNRPREKTILLTFGGLGLEKIPYQNLEKFPDWQFITFDSSVNNLPNLVKITDRQYRPVDFMGIVGRVISKPGYSTFAEALRNDVPIVTLSREDFAESPILLAGIQKYSQHQIISPAEFFESNWNFLHESLSKPFEDIHLNKNGTETIANAVMQYFST
jgi:hypothetical protein